MSEKLLRMAARLERKLYLKKVAADYTQTDYTELVRQYWGLEEQRQKLEEGDPKYQQIVADQTAIRAELGRRRIEKTPGFTDTDAMSVPQIQSELDALKKQLQDYWSNYAKLSVRARELEATLSTRSAPAVGPGERVALR